MGETYTDQLNKYQVFKKGQALWSYFGQSKGRLTLVLASPPFIPFRNRQWLVDRSIHTSSDYRLRGAVASSRIHVLARRAEACFSLNGSLSPRAARILSESCLCVRCIAVDHV
jgi:hypothetical protein